VNFSVFSKNATLMELLLFDNADALVPANVIRLVQGTIALITTGTRSSPA